jgi:predicted secreted protein
MTLVGGIVIFSISWMLILFMVLPWGVRGFHESDEEIEPGSVESAPIAPRIWTKFAITTIITGVLFAIIWATAEYDLIDYRSLFLD